MQATVDDRTSVTFDGDARRPPFSQGLMPAGYPLSMTIAAINVLRGGDGYAVGS